MKILKKEDVENEIINQLRGAYYLFLDDIKEEITNKNKLEDAQLFITHFDHILGPTLAASSEPGYADNAISSSLGIKIFKNQKSFDILNDELKEHIIALIDTVLESNEEVETILKFKESETKNKWIFFRFFRVKNINTKGEKEDFMTVFVSEKFNINTETINSITKEVKNSIQNYFDLFNQKYMLKREIVQKLFLTVTSSEETPTDESIKKLVLNYLIKKEVKIE